MEKSKIQTCAEAIELLGVLMGVTEIGKTLINQFNSVTQTEKTQIPQQTPQ